MNTQNPIQKAMVAIREQKPEFDSETKFVRSIVRTTGYGVTGYGSTTPFFIKLIDRTAKGALAAGQNRSILNHFLRIGTIGGLSTNWGSALNIACLGNLGPVTKEERICLETFHSTKAKVCLAVVSQLGLTAGLPIYLYAADMQSKVFGLLSFGAMGSFGVRKIIEEAFSYSKQAGDENTSWVFLYAPIYRIFRITSRIDTDASLFRARTDLVDRLKHNIEYLETCSYDNAQRILNIFNSVQSEALVNQLFKNFDPNFNEPGFVKPVVALSVNGCLAFEMSVIYLFFMSIADKSGCSEKEAKLLSMYGMIQLMPYFHTSFGDLFDNIATAFLRILRGSNPFGSGLMGGTSISICAQIVFTILAAFSWGFDFSEAELGGFGNGGQVFASLLASFVVFNTGVELVNMISSVRPDPQWQDRMEFLGQLKRMLKLIEDCSPKMLEEFINSLSTHQNLESVNSQSPLIKPLYHEKVQQFLSGNNIVS